MIQQDEKQLKGVITPLEKQFDLVKDKHPKH